MIDVHSIASSKDLGRFLFWRCWFYSLWSQHPGPFTFLSVEGIEVFFLQISTGTWKDLSYAFEPNDHHKSPAEPCIFWEEDNYILPFLIKFLNRFWEHLECFLWFFENSLFSNSTQYIDLSNTYIVKLHQNYYPILILSRTIKQNSAGVRLDTHPLTRQVNHTPDKQHKVNYPNSA